ncbi:MULTISPECIES: acyl-CoA dehydrogenase family protein [unclassified Rhodococcus (in: high G+C Gram-positive bacteria)]|uniref:acyl-CoA dehydrogenase family protein n=1 Tax=unclassified Rhodococcus (in: high G+C Gram-positive bacteria) TaxID=192944 RepID=UPI00163A093F|nr:MULTISPECIES: acyl-CoA dehydrogenase family protein [unclassified Rhodococcus (in: high G+C Gram-positive bacteria)]MBC2637813.1 acyl-CoA/acyl-ACP dehydrogenase [Rhodococcus sp. 3A]MBC2897441.1 acyl-CoA/acyl-ACP dehydrogenase [Rhodococcus sp. 4CII]
MSTTILTDEAAQLAATVADVVATWQLPAAGRLVPDAEHFHDQWKVAEELGWTTILDDVDCTSFEGLAQAVELITAAAAVTRALAHAGAALPVRQTLVARALASQPIATGSIVVSAHSFGVWDPIASAFVGADGTTQSRAAQGPVDRDVAARPVHRADHPEDLGDQPDGVLGQFLLVEEIAGAAHGAIEQARAYVSSRVQFGRPLIKLPAVAQELGRLTIAQLQLDEAIAEFARRLHTGSPDRIRFAALAARALACDVASDVAAHTHQLHGALGLTADATLRHHTLLLWADRDEGLHHRSWGVQRLPTCEVDLWSLSQPEPAHPL